MRKLLLLSLVLLTVTVSFGQRRARYDTTYLRISDVQSRLDKAIGWANQGNGKWESAKNKIPYILSEKEILSLRQNALDKDQGRRQAKKGKARTEARKLGRDNFSSIELHDVNIQNKAFKILIIKKLEGEFEFPVISEGFRSVDVLEYFVFSEEKMAHFFPKKFEFDRPYIVSLDAFTSGKIPYWSSKDYMALISSKIQTSVYKSEMAGYSITNLIVALNPVMFNGKKLMRFNLVRSYPKDFVVKNYAFGENAKELFDHFYYEVGFDSFRDLIGNSNTRLEFDEDPTDFEGWYRRGLYQYDYSDYYGAIESFDKALRMWPKCDLFMVYAQRANAKHQVQDYYGAITDYNTALDLEPKEPDEYETWVRSYYNRGVSKFLLNDVDDACYDWKKALEMGLEDSYDLIKSHCK
jgi:tetratricopeptide (TPR) repeat protein